MPPVVRPELRYGRRIYFAMQKASLDFNVTLHLPAQKISLQAYLIKSKIYAIRIQWRQYQ